MSLIPFGYWAESVGIPSSDLLFYYDPGDPSSYPGSGTTLYDLSSNGYNGTINGATYSTSDGGKFVYDGVNDRIQLNSNIISSMYSTSFTICHFVKPSTSPPSVQCMSSYANDGSATQRRLRMRIYSDGILQMSYFANDLATSSGLITFGSWDFITMQYDSVSDTSRIWQKTTQRASSSVGPFLSASGSRGYLGCYDANSEWMKGDIGVVVGYSKNLSSEEISQVYNAFKSRYGL
jgi:hypothetical protein